MRYRFALMFVLVLFLCGCTTNKTDPSQVGWGDLIGPGRARLDRHLDAKRDELHAKETTIESLHADLDVQRDILSSLEIDLVAAQRRLSTSKIKHGKILGQIQTNRSKLRTVSGEVRNLREEQGKVPSKELVASVERLDQEVELLKATITELLLIEADYATEGT